MPPRISSLARRWHLLEVAQEQARAIALEAEIDERMHGLAVRRVVRVAVEEPDQVAARELVRAGASERVAEKKARRSPLGRLRERLEARRFDEVDEIADRFVAAPGDELLLGRGELVPQALCRKRGRRCEPALVEGLLVREHRGALRVGGRRGRGGAGVPRRERPLRPRSAARRFAGFRSFVARFFRGGSLRRERSERGRRGTRRARRARTTRINRSPSPEASRGGRIRRPGRRESPRPCPNRPRP